MGDREPRFLSDVLELWKARARRSSLRGGEHGPEQARDQKEERHGTSKRSIIDEQSHGLGLRLILKQISRVYGQLRRPSQRLLIVMY